MAAKLMNRYILSILLIVFLNSCAAQTTNYFWSHSGAPELATVRINFVSQGVTWCRVDFSGEVTGSGNLDVTETGVVFDDSPNPIVDDPAPSNDYGQISISSGVGIFNSTFSLRPSNPIFSNNRKYYFRAYAINSKGVSYSEQDSLTTIMDPDVSLDEAINITATSASVGYNISLNGNELNTIRLKYSINSDLSAPFTELTSTQIGDKTFELTGLANNTTYYAKGGHSSACLQYFIGNTISFTTQSTTTIPTVTTSTASSITNSTATTGGNATDDGGASITAKGTVWSSVTSNPTLSNNQGSTNDGTGTGSFSSSLTGLSGNTTYYHRAYATNSNGDGYGSVLSFTTTIDPTEPTVITADEGTPATQTTKDVRGSISDNNGSAITERGFVYATNPSPDLGDNVKVSSGTSLGLYTDQLTGLTQNTTYYYRAYATNGIGTGYGDDYVFTTAASSATSPTVIYVSTTEISNSTAKLSGNVTSDGGAVITERGFVYSTSPSVDVNDNKIIVSGTTGSYDYVLTGLSASTTFYVNAYAINSQGTSYGTETSFATTAVINTPTVIINDPENISYNSATADHQITNNGGEVCSTRGLVWDTSSGVFLGVNETGRTTEDGSDEALKSSTMSSLDIGQTYYAKAYAINSAGAGYSEEKSFTTLSAAVPSVTLNTITDITNTNALANGTVTSDNGATITARGFVYATTPNPDLTDNVETTSGTIGSYSIPLTGLTEGETYYVRAYATNGVGTSYSNEISFTTLTIDPPTVVFNGVDVTSLGSIAELSGVVTGDGGGNVSSRGYVWSLESNTTNPTLENNDGSFASGTGAGVISTLLLSDAAITVGLSYYANSYATNEVATSYGTPERFNLYDISGNGYLYNFIAVEDSREIANTEWSVPTTSDFNTLISFLGGSSVAGGKLKEGNYSHWTYPNTGATNSSGFNARGSGARFTSSGFSLIREIGSYWSQTRSVGNLPQSLQLSNLNAIASIDLDGTGTLRGYSVRLIKDSTTLTDGQTSTYTGNDGTVYNTICIGTQEWMSENLYETEFRNGDPIPVAESQEDWNEIPGTPRRCVYDNNEAYK